MNRKMKFTNAENRHLSQNEKKCQSRRDFLLGATGALVSAPSILRGQYRVFDNSSELYSARTIQLMEDSVVIDLLNQFLYRRDQREIRRAWLDGTGTFTEYDWKRFNDTGITAISFGSGSDNYDGGIELFTQWNEFLEKYPQWLMRISSVADFDRAKQSGRYGIIYGCQDGGHFRSEKDVETFYQYGQRISQLTYNHRNLLGSGAIEPNDEGVTELGAKVIARMNDVGMAVDIAHAGDTTKLDVLSLSSRPVILSHGSCRTLCPQHFRAASDEAIRALAKTGGVMGILFVANMIKDIESEKVTIDYVIDHFDHVGRLVGYDHVAIGSDAGIETNDLAPEEDQQTFWENVSPLYRQRGTREAANGLEGQKKIYNLTEGFVRRGYTDEQIRLILGENWKRALRENWRSA